MSAIKKITRPKPVVLITVEGWGIAPAHPGNAITTANPTYFNHLVSHYPALALTESESGTTYQPSSEASHLRIGLGRALSNSKLYIDGEISNGNFLTALEKLSPHIHNRRLHLIGLISSVDIEASLHHLEAIVLYLTKTPHQEVFLHAILDGRDMSPEGGEKLLADIEKKIANVPITIATVTGRLHALDVHHHTSRIQKTVAALTLGQGNHVRSIASTLKESYGKKIYDEEFPPTVITDTKDVPLASITSDDVIVFLNFDSVSMCELATALIANFPKPPIAFSLGEYNVSENIQTLFKTPVHLDSLGEIISEAGFRQLRISDSEGFSDITVGLNGGKEQPFSGEERRLISIPLSEDKTINPLGSNEALAKEVVKAVEENKYDFIAVNFSSIDRVAHSGDITATKAAIVSVDNALHKIVSAVLETPGVVVITGTHGLAEKMSEQSEETFLQHSTNPVPLILAGKQFAGYSLGLPEAIGGDLSILSPAGSLLDIAPTILKLLRLSVPVGMTGKSFFDELRLV